MKKTDVDSIEKLDVYYNKTRKMKFASNVKIDSIKDVYYNMYVCEIDGNTHFKYADKTYFKNGTIQCKENKYRSIDDFIKVCKAYLPQTNVKDVFLFLLKEEERLLKEENRYFLFSRCPAIRKYNIRGVSPYIGFDRISKYNLNSQFTNLNMTLNTLL